MATQEAVWLRTLLTDVEKPLKEPIVITENNGAITTAKNPEGHARTKHIDTGYQFLPLECNTERSF